MMDYQLYSVNETQYCMWILNKLAGEAVLDYWIIDSISHETPHWKLGLLFEHLRLIIYSLLSFYLLFYPSSPDMPENEATFAISAGGVTDAKEWTIKGREIC